MNPQSYEAQNGAEAIKDFNSKIDLRFFRHDEKESNPIKNDYDIELTPKGREHAKSKAEDTNLAQAVAFGSPRRRTQETAGFVMAGAEDKITGNESFEELKGKLDEGINYGSKINTDMRLNFELEGKGVYVQAAVDAFKKGELLRFLVEKSDQMAKETGDELSSTYSKMAASIAQIIQKYVGIAPRWDELVKDDTKQYEPVLERFFGTHQTIQESFLAKVIEQTDGQEARDAFISFKKKGFDYAEGFEAEVITKEGNPVPVIKIKYTAEGASPEESFTLEKELPLELIERIAKGN